MREKKNSNNHQPDPQASKSPSEGDPLPPAISPHFADPLHPTPEERERLRNSPAFARKRRTGAMTGRGPSSPSAPSSGFASLGEILSGPDWQAKLSQIAERGKARNAERMAAFLAGTGPCPKCGDTGPCDFCERGKVVAEQQKQQEKRRARTDMLKQIPERFQDCTLDSYPVPRSPAVADLRAFLAHWDGRQGLFLKGPYGVGKTGLLVGVLREIAARWDETPRRMRFFTGPDLLGFLRDGFDHDQKEDYSNRLFQIRSTSLLAIDDLGAEKPTEWVREQLFEIADHRYGARLPTFVTSNFGLGELAERIGERVIDRLVCGADIIAVEGRNLRWRDAQP